MKSKFSSAWQSSKQPRKQRKFKANAPLHTKHKFLNANLSKSLRQKYGKRSLPLRKGDEVLVMRGSFRKKKSKVETVDLKRTRFSLDNINRTKKDGTKVAVWLNPSSVQIQTLNLDDKERMKKLNVKEKYSSQKMEAQIKSTGTPKPADRDSKDDKTTSKEK
jgi:large subunit ribosomal protein L24